MVLCLRPAVVVELVDEDVEIEDSRFWTGFVLTDVIVNGVDKRKIAGIRGVYYEVLKVFKMM